MKFLKVILIVTNLSLSLLLLGSSASAYVSPLNCWPLAFLGMMFPFFLALLLISFLALLMFRSKWCIISGLALLFTSGFWGKVYQMSGEDSPSYSASKHVKVMSFNVRLFDLYNWSNNRKTREEIIQFIRKENPDVIAFQEYYSNEDGYHIHTCLLYTSPSPRDLSTSRMPSSA